MNDVSGSLGNESEILKGVDEAIISDTLREDKGRA